MPAPQPSNKQGLAAIFYVLFLALLFLHFYYFCYLAFAEWHVSFSFADRLAANMAHAPVFRHRFPYKLVILGSLIPILLINGPGSRRPTTRQLLKTFAIGLPLFFGSDLALCFTGEPKTLASVYILLTVAGLIFLYLGCGALIDRFRGPSANEIFNRYNESFPQEERHIGNDFSLHFNARYLFRNQTRPSQINLVNRFRGTLIVGGPGSGKTSHLIRPIIQQSVAQHMALLVYDLKFDNLTRLTYNTYLKERAHYTVEPKFYCVNFHDLTRSHRCNPLDPATLTDADDARNIARIILVGLNPSWANRSGEFFVESAIGFLTANLWFLRRYQDGRYCTLPHLIEFSQGDFAKLFSVLQSDKHVQTLIQPFISALQNKTYRQLQSQVDSARIGLLALASPTLYYLLSGNDFTLDLNNLRAPKIICLGSMPEKQDVYGHVIALYLARLLKLVNRRGGWPCEICLDEFASLPPVNLHTTLAEARENKVSVTFGIQDLSQLRSTYGRDRADSLFNLPGNIFCGQVSGDAAKLVSDRIGNILQEKSSTSTNSRDQSTSQSTHLDPALPPSRIATLSSGEFTGITADSPDQPLELKAFHARFHADFAAMQAEEAAWQPLPEVHPVTPEAVESRFLQIKTEAAAIIDDQLRVMKRTRSLSYLIIPKRKKNGGNPRSGWRP
jgi:Type IV secretory system Conjugative DNA transfer/YWFCY protein